MQGIGPEHAVGALALTLVIIVVALVFAAAVVGVAVYLAVKQLKGRTDGIRSSRAALDALARQPGWARTQSGAQGTHRGVVFRVSQLHVRSGPKNDSRRITEITASLGAPLGLGLAVGTRGPLDFLRLPSGGPQPFTLGHPHFDALFECKAHDAQRAAALLQRVAQEMLAAGQLTRFVMNDAEATLRDQEWALDPSALSVRLDALANVVGAVARARGS